MPLKNPLYLLFLLLVIGCDQRSPQQCLVDFMNDPENKIKQTIQVGDVRIIVKLLPQSYRASTATKEDYWYFSVKIEIRQKEKPAKEKLLYLDFDMQSDFILLRGQDSIAAAICQRIQNGQSGSYEYLLSFDDDHSDKDCILFYKDKSFGIGTVAFVYAQQDIAKIPVLKTLDVNESHF